MPRKQDLGTSQVFFNKFPSSTPILLIVYMGDSLEILLYVFVINGPHYYSSKSS